MKALFDSKSERHEVKVVVSGCLMGERVRYDGGHKLHALLTTKVAALVTLVSVCPEAELGLGIPRETVHLLQHQGRVRMRGTETGIDHTQAMRDWAEMRVKELIEDGAAGFVLKAGSPSCGLVVAIASGTESEEPQTTVGLFAAEIGKNYPQVPLIDEMNLNDDAQRDEFLESVFAYARAQREGA